VHLCMKLRMTRSVYSVRACELACALSVCVFACMCVGV